MFILKLIPCEDARLADHPLELARPVKIRIFGV
jgi:hypothetical protein